MKNLFLLYARLDSKFCLIGKINGLSAQSRRAHRRMIQAKSNESIHALANRKRQIGIDARHHLLAYAFMRGLSYSSIEKSCRSDNKPSPDYIFKIVASHLQPFGKIDNINFSPEIVEQWLRGE